ncbi:hypothetical protein H4R34_000259 [Dimargaris verticillata]|uniref:Lung seven transmembrane receptor-domain-containing protein n=1 Tax=Dimargaris verticillata TaxID=2761393 RepID=A0A9W8B5N5_9FUNG|nr:hypothetical protein H4R34_000259 [Dimargaris verticillata]
MHTRPFLVYLALLAWALLAFGTTVHARAELHVVNDQRRLIRLMQFGFLPQAHVTLQLKGIRYAADQQAADSAISPTHPLAVLISRASTPAQATIYLKQQKATSCPLNDPSVEDLVKSGRVQVFLLDTPDDPSLAVPSSWNYTHTVTTETQGFWTVLVVNCQPTRRLNFQFHSDALNPSENHLSAGDIPLPRLYLAAGLAYLGLCGLWAWLLQQFKQSYKRVQPNDLASSAPIAWHHQLLLGFLMLVAVHKLLQSYKFTHVAQGMGNDVWVIGFYVFAFLKGLLGILIVALIASGWLFVRLFLTSTDKKVIMCVVPLQVLANIAHIVQSESAIGSVERSTWMSIVPFVDFGAFLVILWTIIQTRRHLQRASEVDDKAADNLRKYKVWGSFYIYTLIYLYGTRIVAQYLNISLPYHYIRWVSELIIEVTSIGFYMIIGYIFRPLGDLSQSTLSLPSSYNEPGSSRGSRRRRHSDDLAIDDPWQDFSHEIYIPLNTRREGTTGRLLARP